MAEVYWRALQRYIVGARAQLDRENQRQDIAVCLTLSVATVETFLNTYARAVAYRLNDPVMLAELKRTRSLEQKLTRWPEIFLGKPLPPDCQPLSDFRALKNRRNNLLHFRGELWRLHLGRSLRR
jgi:hypothetical protein